ncbi:thiol-activated cytolysin family protein [Halobellus captivus]|uniref:thiol-activated cytolysin family protein n=1 Tax=Halobellus captivus TaxID=2592614 RepID=UPI001396A804|nr:thiol-activated cytolysin family protein [Halobellus captivus]
MSSDELICSETDERIEAGFDEPIMFDRLESTFYPGSIVDTATIPTGAYEQVRADRVPLNLTINPRGMSIDGSTQLIVENPTLGSVRDAQIELRDRLNPAAGEGTAHMDYSLETMHSEETTRTMLGAHYEGVTTEIEANFEYESELEVHEILAQLQQVYYSIDVDLEHPGAFFLDGRTPAPTSAIVDRINYGRIVLFSFRSTRSVTDIKTSVEAAFESPGRSGGGEIEYEDAQTIEESEINATVFGGGADTGGRAVTATSIEDIHDIINEGSSFGPNHPGAPISYHMTYLIDGSDAGVTTATNYTARSCERRATTYEVYDFRLLNHNTGLIGSSDSVDGYIRVDGRESGNRVYPRESEGEPTVSVEGTPLDEEEADKQIWVRSEGEKIAVERAGEDDTSIEETPGVRSLEATATLDFPGGADSIDYSDGHIRVVSNLDVDGNHAGWQAVNVYLGEITGSNADHRLRFTGHDDDPMDLVFKVRPVFN